MKIALCVMMNVLLLSGCVSEPAGPDVMALPGTGKTYDQFRMDDAACRGDAQTNSQPGVRQGNNSVATSAAIGTAVGAGAGALIGLATHDAGAGAAIGAGSGLLIGSAAGSSNSSYSSEDVRTQYNNTYTQCMYAKGNQVPVPAGYTTAPASPVPPDYVPAGAVPPDYHP